MTESVLGIDTLAGGCWRCSPTLSGNDDRFAVRLVYGNSCHLGDERVLIL